MFFFNSYPLDTQPQNEEKPKDNSSFWSGVYSTHPVLDAKKYEKLTAKYQQINNHLKKLTFEKDSLKKTLSDSIKIRKHMTFLRGRFTIPKLTAREKEEKDKKVKIQEMGYRINKLKVEKNKFEKLFKKHEKYLVRKLLWNFASWEVEKKDK